MKPEPLQRQQWESWADAGRIYFSKFNYQQIYFNPQQRPLLLAPRRLGEWEAAEAGAETSPTVRSWGHGVPAAAPPKLLFYFILPYFTLFYFTLFYFILLFYFTLFYYFILPYFTLFYFILFYFTIFYFILLYYPPVS